MGRIFLKTLRWANSAQRWELEEFVVGLRSANSMELALFLVFATVVRHNWAKRGFDFLHPAVCLAQDPTLPLLVRTRIRQLEKYGRLQEAEANSIWLHTLRSTEDLTLRAVGRDMWAELRRGFPHVEQIAATWFSPGAVNLDGYDVIPDGLAGGAGV